MTIEVLAAGCEGELEYRVYAEGHQSARELGRRTNRPKATTARRPYAATLTYGPPSQVYDLVLEARDKATQRIEQYPLNLQLDVTRTLKKVDNPQAPNNPQVPIKDPNSGKDTK